MTDTGPSMAPLTIGVVSRQYLIWLGFQSVFSSAVNLRIVVHPYCRTTSELLRIDQHPDVVILDLETVRDAIGALKRIRESAPYSKIVLLSGVEDNRRLHEVVRYGIDGVMLTIQPPEVALAMVTSLYPSARTRSQAAHQEAVGRRREMYKQTLNSEMPPLAWPYVVTEREQEVIRLVRRGLSNKEIADRLRIADSTVRHHLTSILDKLGVASRQKLLVQAHRLRSVPVSPP